ncbi:MAG TPA: aspartate aminotransferase family protein [SAR324 cluster bacterium]|jgi:adenosylmethionine-8-amino-7-oxononanoate aminotransferase|nr:aspartate aminotransferase family protein [SAR324 cluster bacterium]HJO45084.1 aspartate aminotransferase family protein [SAR324 cluster bacterium]|tara:strand:- start:2328 stop:3671 length:1344 start_codon:yes stop_codon:yes gene_type:complete
MTALSNQDFISQDAEHLIHPLHHQGMHSNGLVWVKGRGAILEDADGNEYLDGLAGLWNNTAGHGQQTLVDAATQQMSTLPYASGYTGSTNPRAIELAERLAEIMYPKINHFFFTSGGGESSDSNFKMARYYWKLKGKPEKIKVISRQWGYHGVTLAAMSATGISSYWPMFEPRMPGFVHIPSPYPYRYQAPSGESQGIAAANELEKAILREGPDSVAMFLAEPVQGAGGVIVPQEDYFPRIREICDQYEVLFVADEVITGFGRTGTMFGLQHWNVEPDMIQFAKGITSGYFPLGGIGISDEIYQTMTESETAWMHAYTYSSHPVGCSVGLAMLDLIEKEDFTTQARDKGARLLTNLKDTLGDHPNVGDVRGLGMMCAVEIVKDQSNGEEFDASEKIGPKVHQAGVQRGLFSRVRGDVYCLAPPIITSEQQLDQIVDILNDSIKEVLG